MLKYQSFCPGYIAQPTRLAQDMSMFKKEVQTLLGLKYWFCDESLLEEPPAVVHSQFPCPSTFLSGARLTSLSLCSSTQGLLKMHGVSAAQLTTTDQRSITSPCKHPGHAAHSHRRSLCSLKEVSAQISTRRSDYDSERGQRRLAARREKDTGTWQTETVCSEKKTKAGLLLERKKCTDAQSSLGWEEKRRGERGNEKKALGLWKGAVTYYSRSSRRLYLWSIFLLKKEAKQKIHFL